MKREVCDIRKFLVLSLLVTYLFIVLAYLFYLPKYSPLRPLNNNYNQANTYVTIKAPGHVKHTQANILVLLHRVYRSTVENKRGALNSLPQKAILLAFLLFGGITLIKFSPKTGSHLKPFYRSHQHAYLSYCILRI